MIFPGVGSRYTSRDAVSLPPVRPSYSFRISAPSLPRSKIHRLASFEMYCAILLGNTKVIIDKPALASHTYSFDRFRFRRRRRETEIVFIHIDIEGSVTMVKTMRRTNAKENWHGESRRLGGLIKSKIYQKYDIAA